MRLWHKDLIEALPDKQLQGQWRECCLIAKGWRDGTLNHVIINRIKDYPIDDFVIYTGLVYLEMIYRGKNPIWKNFIQYLNGYPEDLDLSADIFSEWHNDRYLRQCYYNLQEKYDCGAVPEDEWQKVEAAVKKTEKI